MILIYLLLAGFHSVVRTDVLQYIAIFFVMITFTFFLVGKTPIPMGEFNLFDAGPINIIGFFIMGIIFPFASPELWQRVYAFKDKKTLKKSIIGSVFIYLIFGGILTVIGLLVKSNLPGLDPDTALIHGFAQLLPVGLSGLAIVVFFAAFMSSIDTYVYTSASSFVQDFFKNLSKAEIVKRIRWAIFGFLFIGTIISILIGDLIDAAFLIPGFVIMISVPAIATWIKPKVSKITINTTFIFGIAGCLFWLIFDMINNNLNPQFIIKVMAVSLFGLIIGSIINRIRTK